MFEATSSHSRRQTCFLRFWPKFYFLRSSRRNALRVFLFTPKNSSFLSILCLNFKTSIGWTLLLTFDKNITKCISLFVRFIQLVMYLNSSAVLFSVKELVLLHMQLSPPWTANTTSTTRYNFSVCTQMNYLMYEWKLQAARQRQSPSKTFYGFGIVPFSDLFFTGVGLVKGGN